MAKPLCEAARGTEASFLWTETQEGAFKAIEGVLLTAPALVLPDINKPFQLFTDERASVAKGVLTQYRGPWKRSVAYLSKRLDHVASGWPSCLHIVAVIVFLVKDADKLTLGLSLTITSPHSIEEALKKPWTAG